MAAGVQAEITFSRKLSKQKYVVMDAERQWGLALKARRSKKLNLLNEKSAQFHGFLT